MPFFLRDIPDATSINIDSATAKKFASTGTAARKFAAPDTTGLKATVATADSQIKTNGELLIEQAASLKGIASSIEQIASDARLSLENTRIELTTTIGEAKTDIRLPSPSFTEEDLSNLRDSKANILVNSLNVNGLSLDSARISNDLYNLVPESVFKTKTQDLSPRTFNPAVPQLDNISVEMDKAKGTVDCFFATLRFSLPLQYTRSGDIKAFRIFRAAILNPTFERGAPPILSMRGIDRLSADVSRTRIKNADILSPMIHRLQESGIFNAVTNLNPIDTETNTRISTSATSATMQSSKNSSGLTSNIQSTSPETDSFLAPGSFDNVDSGVAKDLNVIRNIAMQSPLAGIAQVPKSTIFNVFSTSKKGLLNKSQLELSQSDISPTTIVAPNNSLEFKEIVFASLDKLKATVVGENVEYSYVDTSVSYGRAYKYYVLSINKDMIDSVRSRIVDITIEGIRVPARPSRVFAYNITDAIAMNILVGDKLVEKFEIFRRDSDSIVATIGISNDISTMSGYNTGISKVSRMKNGFIKIGESLNGTQGSGATYYDRNIKPGSRYEYRVYSVDIFGNKSESPLEFVMFVKEKQSKPNELTRPTISAEVDSLTNKARIEFRCNDSRVKDLFLSRKDLTIKQTAFTTPGQVSTLRFGDATPGGHTAIQFEDIIFRGDSKDSSWNGHFENNTGDTIFIDTTVSLDHTYQYRIYGVDKFGNHTSFGITKPVMITRRPQINPPINIMAEIRQGPGFTLGGINLTWQDGNVDITSEDRLGNRTSLSDSSVRTLYQIERKRAGDERWMEFPMVEQLSFFDASISLAGQDKPRYRPDWVEDNQTYVYRIKALQTGSFQSNYGNYIEVFAALPVVAPTNFRLRASDTKVSPFYVVLNWDTPSNSGVIDKWEIERADVNNFAASQLNLKNPKDFNLLTFNAFRVVHRESSRFQSVEVDRSRISAMGDFKVNQSIFTGDHQFQDTSVSFGNTYFYRIRAVSTNSRVSNWSYRGIKLTEESYERRVTAIMPPTVKAELVNSLAPVITQPIQIATGDTSFGLQPTFSKPTTTPPDIIISPISVMGIAKPTVFTPEAAISNTLVSTHETMPYTPAGDFAKTRETLSSNQVDIDKISYNPQSTQVATLDTSQVLSNQTISPTVTLDTSQVLSSPTIAAASNTSQATSNISVSSGPSIANTVSANIVILSSKPTIMKRRI